MIWNFVDLACMDCSTFYTGIIETDSDWEDTTPCPECGSTGSTWEPFAFRDWENEHDHRAPGTRYERPHSILVIPHAPKTLFK